MDEKLPCIDEKFPCFKLAHEAMEEFRENYLRGADSLTTCIVDKFKYILLQWRVGTNRVSRSAKFRYGDCVNE